ncbi:MAG: photosynthetic complex assembly protein [Cytophagaceae bacterium]|nr:photosynthetic complex assembly protein [Gemmatimonadaceae bacterium]
MQREESAGLPRPVQRGLILLATLAIVLAAVARLTGSGHVTLDGSRPEQVRLLTFADAPDGTVSVRDASTGLEIGTLPSGSGGFARGALRALARERRLRGLGPDAPFVLTRWTGGRLTLDDSSTGAHVELGGFGPDNQVAFAGLLAAR